MAASEGRRTWKWKQTDTRTVSRDRPLLPRRGPIRDWRRPVASSRAVPVRRRHSCLAEFGSGSGKRAEGRAGGRHWGTCLQCLFPPRGAKTESRARALRGSGEPLLEAGSCSFDGCVYFYLIPARRGQARHSSGGGAAVRGGAPGRAQ